MRKPNIALLALGLFIAGVLVLLVLRQIFGVPDLSP
jgi:hypothetical protein